MAGAGVAQWRHGARGNSCDEEVQRSLELLDRVLSEFDDLENGNLDGGPSTGAPNPATSRLKGGGGQQVQGGRQAAPLTSSEAVGPSVVVGGVSVTPEEGQGNSSGHQSEDDGYMSMNGRRARIGTDLLGGQLDEEAEPVETTSGHSSTPDDAGPPPPEEAERIISTLLPRVSPGNSWRRSSGVTPHHTGSLPGPRASSGTQTPVGYTPTSSLQQRYGSLPYESSGSTQSCRVDTWLDQPPVIPAGAQVPRSPKVGGSRPLPWIPRHQSFPEMSYLPDGPYYLHGQEQEMVSRESGRFSRLTPSPGSDLPSFYEHLPPMIDYTAEFRLHRRGGAPYAFLPPRTIPGSAGVRHREVRRQGSDGSVSEDSLCDLATTPLLLRRGMALDLGANAGGGEEMYSGASLSAVSELSDPDYMENHSPRVPQRKNDEKYVGHFSDDSLEDDEDGGKENRGVRLRKKRTNENRPTLTTSRSEGGMAVSSLSSSSSGMAADSSNQWDEIPRRGSIAWEVSLDDVLNAAVPPEPQRNSRKEERKISVVEKKTPPRKPSRIPRAKSQDEGLKSKSNNRRSPAVNRTGIGRPSPATRKQESKTTETKSLPGRRRQNDLRAVPPGSRTSWSEGVSPSKQNHRYAQTPDDLEDENNIPNLPPSRVPCGTYRVVKGRKRGRPVVDLVSPPTNSENAKQEPIYGLGGRKGRIMREYVRRREQELRNSESTKVTEDFGTSENKTEWELNDIGDRSWESAWEEYRYVDDKITGSPSGDSESCVSFISRTSSSTKDSANSTEDSANNGLKGNNELLSVDSQCGAKSIEKQDVDNSEVRECPVTYKGAGWNVRCELRIEEDADKVASDAKIIAQTKVSPIAVTKNTESATPASVLTKKNNRASYPSAVVAPSSTQEKQAANKMRRSYTDVFDGVGMRAAKRQSVPPRMLQQRSISNCENLSSLPPDGNNTQSFNETVPEFHPPSLPPHVHIISQSKSDRKNVVVPENRPKEIEQENISQTSETANQALNKSGSTNTKCVDNVASNDGHADTCAKLSISSDMYKSNKDNDNLVQAESSKDDCCVKSEDTATQTVECEITDDSVGESSDLDVLKESVDVLLSSSVTEREMQISQEDQTTKSQQKVSKSTEDNTSCSDTVSIISKSTSILTDDDSSLKTCVEEKGVEELEMSLDIKIIRPELPLPPSVSREPSMSRRSEDGRFPNSNRRQKQQAPSPPQGASSGTRRRAPDNPLPAPPVPKHSDSLPAPSVPKHSVPLVPKHEDLITVPSVPKHSETLPLATVSKQSDPLPAPPVPKHTDSLPIPYIPKHSDSLPAPKQSEPLPAPPIPKHSDTFALLHRRLPEPPPHSSHSGSDSLKLDLGSEGSFSRLRHQKTSLETASGENGSPTYATPIIMGTRRPHSRAPTTNRSRRGETSTSSPGPSTPDSPLAPPFPGGFFRKRGTGGSQLRPSLSEGGAVPEIRGVLGGWRPPRPASIEQLDRLAPDSGSPWTADAPTKPLTLPPNLTPKFFQRSPRDALRRVTSLLIRKGSTKDTRRETTEPNPAGPGETTEAPRKRGFFKSFWKRSRQYSLDHH